MLAGGNDPTASAELDLRADPGLPGKGVRVRNHVLRGVRRGAAVGVAAEVAQPPQVPAEKRPERVRQPLHLLPVAVAFLRGLRGIPLLSLQGD